VFDKLCAVCTNPTERGLVGHGRPRRHVLGREKKEHAAFEEFTDRAAPTKSARFFKCCDALCPKLDQPFA
jgi:hypothetical protein